VIDLNVRIDFSHTFVEDLDAILFAPDGASVVLFSNIGGGNADFTDTVFDDEAADPIGSGAAPFTGAFRPEEPLANLFAGSGNGTWRIEVTDSAGGDVGTINEWELNFLVGERSVQTDANGNFEFDLDQVPTDVRAVLPADRAFTIPADGLIEVTPTRQPIFSSGFGTVDLTPPAPQVEEVVVNNGESQRSGVQNVQIKFDQIVDIDLETGDVFEFMNEDTAETVVDVPVVNNATGKTVVDITFVAGPSVNQGGGLLDGNYMLAIDSSRVTASSIELDGNGNGEAGGDHIFGAGQADNFYRKYGDYNSSSIVDLLDFSQFRQVFGTSQGDAGYLSGLDNDADGAIGLIDFSAFRQNFGS
jgi:subtilisin-like proprotein convertase family protein